MYEEYFGLRSRPFSVTPSADLFFHSATHRRTLAYLQGQALAGEPLIVLTGDIGAGKTTVLQVLLRNLSDKFAPAVVVSTQLDEIELTRSVLIAFGARAAGNSLDDLLVALRIHLEDLRSRGRRGLVVVDEAQNLSANTLRHLMRLSEPADDAEEAGSQVIIAGQPGLQALVMEAAGERRADELPLYRLGPMSRMDTGAYVRHRLRIAGAANGPTFSADAIDQVQTATGGLPRLVNRLCDRVLMSACLDQTQDIDGVRVADAAAELREELGDSDIPHPDLDNPQPVQAGPIVSHPKSPESIRVGSGVDSDPAPAGPVPSLREPPKRPDSRARGRRRPYWVGAAAAGLLAVSLGWLGYDRSSARNTARLDTARAAGVVVPAERAEEAGAVHPPDASTLSAESPTRPLHPDGHLPVESTSSEVQEPRPPPSRPVDAQAALGLAPSTEATTSPPAAAPACSDAAKALGLCP
jgi:type II secretory pathway predicted ATPase ExeA